MSELLSWFDAEEADMSSFTQLQDDNLLIDSTMQLKDMSSPSHLTAPLIETQNYISRGFGTAFSS